MNVGMVLQTHVSDLNLPLIPNTSYQGGGVVFQESIEGHTVHV